MTVAVGCSQGRQRLRVQPEFTQAPPQCVAVLPLENLSLTSLAGMGFSELFAAELERTGKFAVLEPGAYRFVLDHVEAAHLEPTDPEMLEIFRERLGLDAVIVGSLTEYWYTDDPQVYRDKQPSVAFAARMIDTASGNTLWNATASRTPGALRSRIVMVSAVAADLVRGLVDDLMAKLGEPSQVTPPGTSSAAVCKFEEFLVANLESGARPPRQGDARRKPQKAVELSDGALELVNRLKRGEPFVFRGVGFEYRETTLADGSEKELEKLGNLLSAYPELVVKVIKHTDARGDPDELRNLTERQADAIRERLVEEYGVASEQVRIEGRGGDEPLLPNINRRNRQINRRVELELETPPAGGW